jgi:hypothetical protein
MDARARASESACADGKAKGRSFAGLEGGAETRKARCSSTLALLRSR